MKSTAYKELKLFQFVFAGFIKKINIAKNKEFNFFNVCVKACMKKVLYKVILKLSNLSVDVALLPVLVLLAFVLVALETATLLVELSLP